MEPTAPSLEDLYPQLPKSVNPATFQFGSKDTLASSHVVSYPAIPEAATEDASRMGDFLNEKPAAVLGSVVTLADPGSQMLQPFPEQLGRRRYRSAEPKKVTTIDKDAQAKKKGWFKLPSFTAKISSASNDSPTPPGKSMANTVFKSDISLDAAFEKCSCVAAPPNDRDKRRAVSETPPPPSMLEKRTTEMFAFGQEAPRIPSPRFPVRPGTGAAKQIYNVTEELVRPTSGPNSAQMSAFDAYSALPQQPYAPQHPVQQPQRHYTSSQYDGQSSSTRAYSNPPGNEPARQVSASKESSQLFPSPSQLIEQLYQQPATPNVTVGPPRYETPKIADIPDQKYEYYPEPQQATTSDVYYTQQVTVPTQAIPQEFQQQQMVLPIQPPPPFSLVSGMSSRSSGRTHVTSNQDTPTIILGSRPITPQPCNPQKATFVIPVPTATICELKIENESTLNCLKGARESHRRGFFSTGSHSRSASTTGERGSGTNTIVEGEWHTVSAELKIDSLGGRLEVRVKKLSLCSEVHGWPLKGTHVEESGFNVGSIGKQYVIRVSFLNGRHIFLNFAGAETKMQWWVILKDLTCRFK